MSMLGLRNRGATIWDLLGGSGGHGGDGIYGGVYGVEDEGGR